MQKITSLDLSDEKCKLHTNEYDSNWNNNNSDAELI